MSNTPSERRRLSRINRRARVRFTVDGVVTYGTIMNLSEVGLFLETERALPVGGSVRIPVRIGPDRTLHLDGQVVWSYQPPPSAENPSFARGGAGIELTATPEEFLRFVAQMRSQLQSAPRGVEERFEVFHRVRFQSGQEFLMEYTQNLSRGGMYLVTDQPMEPGAVIRASLEIPGIPEALEVEGKVAYRLDPKKARSVGRAAGCGIQFVNLDPRTKAKLNHYIHRLEIHRARPDRRAAGDIPIEGQLSEYLVPEVLIALLEKEFTGTLVIRRSDIHKIVYLRGGRPIFVESSLETETLGAFLLRQGKITPADLEQSLSELARSDKHHAEIMVAGGMLDAQTLATALVEHQEEKLLNTFPWFEGTYEFAPGTDWPKDILFLPLNTYQVVFQGILRWYDATMISAWMGLDSNTSVRRIRMPPADAIVPPHIHRILLLVTSPHSLARLSRKLQLPYDRIVPSVYSLIIAGWAALDFTNQAETSQPGFKAEPPKPTTAKSEELMGLLRRWVNEDFLRLRRLDFYELLGVEENAPEKVVEAAYEERSKRYTNPEIEQISDDEIRTKIVQIRAWLKLAFHTLKDPNLREYARGQRKRV